MPNSSYLEAMILGNTSYLNAVLQLLGSIKNIASSFLNPETNQLKSEGKLVNANELLKNPYKFIVQKLIEGPSDKSLTNIFH